MTKQKNNSISYVETTSPAVLKTLEALSLYRFLTTNQILDLGIVGSKASISKNIWGKVARNKFPPDKNTKPTRKPWVETKVLATGLPDVHYLTINGAHALANIYDTSIERFPYPTGGVQFSASFANHRFEQINFHIRLRQWAQKRGDTDILFADMDFEVTGSRKSRDMVSKTEIPIQNRDKPIKADAIFGVQTAKATLLYVLEIHNTTETRMVSYQIEQYLNVIANGDIIKKYGIDSAPFVCSVHMKPNVLRGVKQHLMSISGFEAFKPLFLFNTTKQLANDFSKGWTFADNSPANPFPE